MNNQQYPTIEEAEALILWGYNQNPGPWVDHSKVVARTAKVIASKCSLEEDIAFSLGLLHDIGRYEGITDLRHQYAGYKLMEEKGYHDNAKICLTHSFPNKDLDAYNGQNDCTKEETDFITAKMEDYQYNDYDKLIQFCDSISLPQGVCLLEVRLLDVVLRHGKINASIFDKWKAFFEIKKYFDHKCGLNIYELFYDEIVKNSIK